MPQGIAHRGIPVGLAAQLVPVAGDEQEGVVGASAEHEDGEDADRRLVPRNVEGLQHVGGEHRGEAVGDADDEQRHQPEDWAAVGDEQQQGHHRGGGEEQSGVGALEHRAEIGLDRGGAGHLDGDTGRRARFEGGAELLDRRRDPGVAGGGDGDDADGCRLVLAYLQRSGDLALQRGAQSCDRRVVERAVLGRVEDDGAGTLLLREGLQGFDDRRALGADGQTIQGACRAGGLLHRSDNATCHQDQQQGHEP